MLLKGNILAIVLYVIAAMLLLTTCSIFDTNEDMVVTKSSKYQIKKLDEPLVINGVWEKPQWQKVKAIRIGHFMGGKPEHLPKTEVKMLYDDERIYVIFRVEDKYVRSVAVESNSSVWKDSCVEFFFTPGNDVSEGYFNLETNCGGTILCGHRTSRNQNIKMVSSEDINFITIAGSLPRIIDTEIVKPVTWTLEYSVPISLLEKYANIEKPSPGVFWLANFYKCGDYTSHPHWLTWSYVASDKPDFHRPDCFGVLEFGH